MKNFSQILLPLVFCISLSLHGITYYDALRICLESRNHSITAIGNNLSTKDLSSLDQEALHQMLADCHNACASSHDESDTAAVCFLADSINEQLKILIDTQLAKKLAEEEDALVARDLAHEPSAPSATAAVVGRVFEALGSIGSAFYEAREHFGGGASAGPSESPKASSHARRSPAPTKTEDEALDNMMVSSYWESSPKLPFPKGCAVKWLPCLQQGTNQCGVFSALYAFLAFVHSTDIEDLEGVLTHASTKEHLQSLLSDFSGFCDPDSGIMHLLSSDQVQVVVESLFGTTFANASSEDIGLGCIDGKRNMQPARRALHTILKLKKLFARPCRGEGSILSNILSSYKAIKEGSYDRRDSVVYAEPGVAITLQDLDDITHNFTPEYFSLLSAYHNHKTVILLTLTESETSSVNHWLVYVLKKDAAILVIDSLNPSGAPLGARQEVLDFLQDADLTANRFFDETQQFLTLEISRK